MKFATDYKLENFLLDTRLTNGQQEELIADLQCDNWTARTLVNKVNRFLLGE